MGLMVDMTSKCESVREQVDHRDEISIRIDQTMRERIDLRRDPQAGFNCPIWPLFWENRFGSTYTAERFDTNHCGVSHIYVTSTGAIERFISRAWNLDASRCTRLIHRKSAMLPPSRFAESRDLLSNLSLSSNRRSPRRSSYRLRNVSLKTGDSYDRNNDHHRRNPDGR